MMYLIQFRQSSDDAWTNYKEPVSMYSAEWRKAQCQAEHPDCEVRAVPSFAGGGVKDQRWAIEQGDGGDHDMPYAFRLPFDGKVRDMWTRLAARWQRGEFTEDRAA